MKLTTMNAILSFIDEDMTRLWADFWGGLRKAAPARPALTLVDANIHGPRDSWQGTRQSMGFQANATLRDDTGTDFTHFYGFTGNMVRIIETAARSDGSVDTWLVAAVHYANDDDGRLDRYDIAHEMAANEGLRKAAEDTGRRGVGWRSDRVDGYSHDPLLDEERLAEVLDRIFGWLVHLPAYGGCEEHTHCKAGHPEAMAEIRHHLVGILSEREVAEGRRPGRSFCHKALRCENTQEAAAQEIVDWEARVSEGGRDW